MLQQALRESMRVQNGRVPLLANHLMRLAAGGCDASTLDRAQREALSAASRWPHELGKMTLVVTPSGAVMVDVSDTRSSLDVDGGPAAVLVPAECPTLPPGNAKPADRSQWDRYRTIAQAQHADVAVLVDDSGHLIDGSSQSVWLRLGDRLLTPSSPPAIAGVSRGLVLECASGLGFQAVEADITAEDYETADEVFFTTAVYGAAPARGREGPAVEAVQQLFGRLFSQ